VQATTTTNQLVTRRNTKMQALINLAIVMMPIGIMGLALLIMGEF